MSVDNYSILITTFHISVVSTVCIKQVRVSSGARIIIFSSSLLRHEWTLQVWLKIRVNPCVAGRGEECEAQGSWQVSLAQRAAHWLRKVRKMRRMRPSAVWGMPTQPAPVCGIQVSKLPVQPELQLRRCSSCTKLYKRGVGENLPARRVYITRWLTLLCIIPDISRVKQGGTASSSY